MKILYVQHDMLVWASARQWSYTTHMAYVEGLQAQGHDVTVLLTSCWDWAPAIVADRKFDQVWINDVNHSIGRRPQWEAPVRLTEEDFQWLSTLAPVRVGIVMETLHYDPEDYAEIPEFKSRVPLLQQTVLPYVTHFAVVDENDVRHIENMGAQAVWNPCHVPARFFRRSDVDISRPAVFIGSAYARRAKYLQNDRLKGLLEFRASAEHQTQLPAMFDQLHNVLRPELMSKPYVAADYETYVGTSQAVRAKLFDLFLDGLWGGMATVNLPSFVKTYAGRVVESMSIGQPVVSWRIPGHPMTARLFREDETILFFEKDDPEHLAHQLARLRNESGLGRRLGAQSLKNAKAHHTSEHRAAQLVRWTQTGVAPIYWD
jgi:hypothetical protein